MKTRMEENLSVLGQRCVKFGLDPHKTSIFKLECVKFGLDPVASSMIQLKAVQLGLSKDTTPMKLEKHGVNVSGYIEIWTAGNDDSYVKKAFENYGFCTPCDIEIGIAIKPIILD